MSFPSSFMRTILLAVALIAVTRCRDVTGKALLVAFLGGQLIIVIVDAILLFFVTSAITAEDAGRFANVLWSALGFVSAGTWLFLLVFVLKNRPGAQLGTKD